MPTPCSKSTCPPCGDFLEYNAPALLRAQKLLLSMVLHKPICVNTKPLVYRCFYETSIKTEAFFAGFYVKHLLRLWVWIENIHFFPVMQSFFRRKIHNFLFSADDFPPTAHTLPIHRENIYYNVAQSNQSTGFPLSPVILSKRSAPKDPLSPYPTHRLPPLLCHPEQAKRAEGSVLSMPCQFSRFVL